MSEAATTSHDRPGADGGARLRRYPQHFDLLGETGLVPGTVDEPVDQWSDRCCGLACLRTLLQFHDRPVPTQTELLGTALAHDAFTDAGIVHRALVSVGQVHGLSGAAVPAPDLADLLTLGAAGYPSIVSVTHQLPEDGRRGGHLVVVSHRSSTPHDDVHFVDPSRWGRTHHAVPFGRFGASYSGRAVVLWPSSPDGTPPHAVQRFLGGQ